jgi:hypothetical protein
MRASHLRFKSPVNDEACDVIEKIFTSIATEGCPRRRHRSRGFQLARTRFNETIANNSSIGESG